MTDLKQTIPVESKTIYYLEIEDATTKEKAWLTTIRGTIDNWTLKDLVFIGGKKYYIELLHKDSSLCMLWSHVVIGEHIHNKNTIIITNSRTGLDTTFFAVNLLQYFLSKFRPHHCFLFESILFPDSLTYNKAQSEAYFICIEYIKRLKIKNWLEEETKNWLSNYNKEDLNAT